MSVSRLVIYPDDYDYLPQNREQIQQALSGIGFIGEALSSSDNQLRFLIGEQFLNFVTFLGCSPAIEIEPLPDGNEDFCHVHISPVFAQLEFVADAAGKGPRCPHCRHEETDWQTLVKNWQADNTLQYDCPGCQQQTGLLSLNWRKAAFAAHVFIEVYSVFPNEAVLADKVLSTLQQATGVPWKYFYSR